jgi:hypothetical protein
VIYQVTVIEPGVGRMQQLPKVVDRDLRRFYADMGYESGEYIKWEFENNEEFYPDLATYLNDPENDIRGDILLHYWW